MKTTVCERLPELYVEIVDKEGVEIAATPTDDHRSYHIFHRIRLSGILVLFLSIR